MIWNKIVKSFHDISDRHKFISEWNQSARIAYIAEEVPFLLEASISMGNGGFKHDISSNIHSGFRIKSGLQYRLTKDDMLTIGKAILLNSGQVRQLILLGFDTLEIYDETTRKGVQWALKEFTDFKMM